MYVRCVSFEMVGRVWGGGQMAGGGGCLLGGIISAAAEGAVAVTWRRLLVASEHASAVARWQWRWGRRAAGVGGADGDDSVRWMAHCCCGRPRYWSRY